MKDLPKKEHFEIAGYVISSALPQMVLLLDTISVKEGGED